MEKQNKRDGGTLKREFEPSAKSDALNMWIKPFFMEESEKENENEQ